MSVRLRVDAGSLSRAGRLALLESRLRREYQGRHATEVMLEAARAEAKALGLDVRVYYDYRPVWNEHRGCEELAWTLVVDEPAEQQA